MRGLIDIGVNLTHDSFDADRDAVLARAARAGVERCIVTGTTVAASARARELAASAPGRLYATAGVHPHHADELDAAGLAALRELLAHEDVVAVGECGLDFFRDFSPRAAQEEAFAAQLALAAEVRLPVFLHQRDAHLELDLYIGVTGWLCDERRGGALREAVTEIPLERLLIETDAPYLLPRDLPEKPRTRRNEPAHLPHILARIAELRPEPAEALAAATRENAERLFGLSRPA